MRKTLTWLIIISIVTTYCVFVYKWTAEGNINAEKQRRDAISEDVIRYLPRP